MPEATDHNLYTEWIYLDADGGLEPAERAQLDRHLLSCAECRREKDELPALFDLLSSDRVPLADDFTDRVMSSLPAAGWEARHPRSWVAAAIALVVLVGLSAGLVVSSSAPAAGPLAAVIDLFAAAATAGAGLLAASWQGLGMAVGELVGGSALQTGVFALFVLCLDVLFVRFLMRSWRREAPARSESPNE